MNSKLIIISIVGTLVLLFGGMFWLSRPEVKPEVLATSVGKLTATEQAYDFGTVSMAKGLVSHKFNITNSDTVSATVTKLFTSCMCTKAGLEVNGQKWGPFGMPGHNGAIPSIAAEIPSGQTGTIEAIFDPAAHGPAGIGQIDRTITLEQNGQPPLELTIRALVTP
ncbi:MAG: DUF1573 domain-containing protein [bacterium]|nr:DUF1573 domain-containing protein [bacterium]